MELKLILELISTTTAINKELVLSNSRKREIVTARFLFLAFANRHSKSDLNKFQVSQTEALKRISTLLKWLNIGKSMTRILMLCTKRLTIK